MSIYKCKHISRECCAPRPYANMPAAAHFSASIGWQLKSGCILPCHVTGTRQQAAKGGRRVALDQSNISGQLDVELNELQFVLYRGYNATQRSSMRLIRIHAVPNASQSPLASSTFGQMCTPSCSMRLFVSFHDPHTIALGQCYHIRAKLRQSKARQGMAVQGWSGS